MDVDWGAVATVAAPLLALLVGVGVNRVFAERPKLVTYLGHIAVFDVHPPGGQAITVHTHALIVRNTGRKPAENVRLGHSHLPNFKVYPSIDYRTDTLPGGGQEIVFPRLVPKEEITVSYLYFPPVTWSQINTHIKSDHGPARVLNVLLTPQPSKWVVRLFAFFCFIGAVAMIYALFELLRWFAG